MLEDRLELRSLLWLAGVFFLGAIATVAIGRTSMSLALEIDRLEFLLSPRFHSECAR